MPVNAGQIVSHLQSCGYSVLREEFPLTAEVTVPLVAFSHAPADARSACIAVIEKNRPNPSDIAAIRGLGAPIVFVCAVDGLQWWKQSPIEPERITGDIPPASITGFFAAHKGDFEPSAVYRAKTWGRYDQEYQLSFVDLGLMSLVEEEIGERLVDLIVRNVDRLKSTLRWKALNESKAQWLLKAVFWLLSAKVLKDKSVGSFASLDLLDVGLVFEAVAKHFGTQGIDITSENQRGALKELAFNINQFSSLELATTESLAHVYENALVSKATRKALGTHSTPAYLVDFIVGRLGKHIEALPLEARSVFEPACGHAAFLVSAMRYLTELLPNELRENGARRRYFRKRIRGIETDAFALEIARLSLSLTDIPNPNGWDLKPTDMFMGSDLESGARNATIFLSNPPFENFTGEERRWYAERNVSIGQANKASEVFCRTIKHLPGGAVIGLVAPQGILDSKDATVLRSILLQDFELTDVYLLPDKVFEKACSESVLILGVKRQRRNTSVAYSRIREHDFDLFRTTNETSSTTIVPQDEFLKNSDFSMRFAEFSEVWSFLQVNDTLSKIANVGKGFEFKGSDLPPGVKTFSDEEFKNSVQAFVHFSVDHLTHSPTLVWANLQSEALRRKGSGTVLGIPQVLLNSARVSRGPWRLKAIIDRDGHAFSNALTAIRPKAGIQLEFLWAILNSPLANAYAFAHMLKRHNLVKDVKKIPLPKGWQDSGAIVSLVKEYFAIVRPHGGIDTDAARRCFLRLDAAIMQMYGLPKPLERQILDLFRRFSRLGVPFEMGEYMPATFEEEASLFEYIQITDEWSITNRRREELIRKKVKKTLISEEKPELARLQQLAGLRQQLIAPLPIKEMERVSKLLTGQNK